jgi:hypothetical protein
MRPPPVLMQLLLFPKSTPHRLHMGWTRKRGGGEKLNARKRRGRRRKLVGQNGLRMAIVPTKLIVDGGKSVLVHDLHVDIGPGTQSPRTPIILGVGRGHHQVVTNVCRCIGYLTTMPSNVTERGTGADGHQAQEERCRPEIRGQGAIEVILRIFASSSPCYARTASVARFNMFSTLPMRRARAVSSDTRPPHAASKMG